MEISRRYAMSQIGLLGTGMSIAASGAKASPASLPVLQESEFVGLAIDVARVRLREGVTSILTNGFARPGVGAARYQLNSLAPPDAMPGRLILADGRCFDLIPDSMGVSPQMFGALGDYDPITGNGTDDTASFRACLSFCMAKPGDRAWALYLIGHYLLTENDMLGDLTRRAHSKQGFVIHGQGTANSCITWRPKVITTVKQYFFRDGLASQGAESVKNALLDFELSGFTLYLDARNLRDDMTLGGFRMSGWTPDPAPEQAWAWRDFRIQGDAGHLDRNGPALSIVGNANGSEISLIRCAGQYLSAAIQCSNAQAVNHSVLNSNFELMTGSIFQYVRGGGLTVIAGSYIIDDFNRPSNDRLPASMYLLSVGGDGTGQINDFMILGSRLELRSDRAKVFGGGDLNTASSVCLLNVNCAAVVGKHRSTFDIAESSLSVTVDGGSWTSPRGYAEPIVVSFLAGPDSAYIHRGSGPRVVLTGSIHLSPGIHEFVSWKDNTSTGTVQIGDQAVCGVTSGAKDEVAYTAPDVHLPATLTNPKAKGFVAKGMTGKQRRSWHINFYAWPNRSKIGEMAARFTLPPGAILLSIRAIRQTSSGPHGASRLAILSEDRSMVVSFPDIADFAAGFDIRTVDLYHVVPQRGRTYRLIDQAALDTGLRETGVGDALMVDFIA
jgi:hypothetical protein